MTFFGPLDQYGERVALIDESGRRWTYARLLVEGAALAGGVGGRKQAFLLAANNSETVAAYVGFLRAGVVPVLLNQALDRELLAELAAAYRPAFIFGPEERLAAWPGGRLTSRLGGQALWATGLEIDYQLHDDLALLLTTSGSTGSPKLVRQSYANLVSNTEAIIEYLGIRPEDRAISTMPLHYTYGLSILNTHLARGASLIMTEASPISPDFWRLLRQEEATTFGGVPYFYEILKKLRFGRMDLPSLKYLTQAGGRLEPDLLLEFCQICREKGWRFIVMYGQTEATARMSWLPWEEAFSRPASIGRAIPGGRFWLADDDQRPIDRPGEVGELVYEGPNVTLGYAESRHDLAKGDERGKRLLTGDMARFDEDGFFYLAGRKKRFLKLFGSRVNLDEIEARLNQAGLDCACAGEDDRLTVYVTDEKLMPTAEKYLSERLTLNRAGFRIAAVKEIPRNEAGKILYADLS